MRKFKRQRQIKYPGKMERRTSKKCRNGCRPPEEYVNFPVKRMDTGREVVSAGKGNTTGGQGR